MSPPSQPHRHSTRTTPHNDVDDPKQLFVDPMLGAPLPIYIDADVSDRAQLVQLVKMHGGSVSSGYSAVPYILVDPVKESGQSLYLQYAGKKGKAVLDAKWIHRCIEAGQLQSYHTNFAGCRVTGTERPSNVGVKGDDRDLASQGESVPPHSLHSPLQNRDRDSSPTLTNPHSLIATSPTEPQDSLMQTSPLVFHSGHRVTPSSQSWTHPTVLPARNAQYTAGPPIPPWNDSFDGITHPPTPTYEYHYRAEEHWPNHNSDFYTQPFDPNVAFSSSNHPYASIASTSTTFLDESDSQRGRKRAPRTRSTPLPSGRKPRMVTKPTQERSPTPPSRVLKSTHGGNHFTEEDVKYLSRYIDHCRNQGLALSLREICERLAVKAPHHTFYSWRRYCNKHQIRLGGYEMQDATPSETSGSPRLGTLTAETPPTNSRAGHESSDVALHVGEGRMDPHSSRVRSPSPPRLLFRSTTGKGVAFTREDVDFLIRYLDFYRSHEEEVNMVTFWKRVAEKAPHHSRASWMKYWRRHKHELEGNIHDIPAKPEKKRKYDLNDDILLAKHFAAKPTGTSDAVFQGFAREYPHHPWKGWQEHHRIHKAKIDHLIHQINNGQVLSTGD